MQFVSPQLPKFETLEDAELFLRDLCDTLAENFQNVEEITFQELHRAPDKPRNGRLYYADGADWDPGSGRGLYIYDSAGPTWVKL